MDIKRDIIGIVIIVGVIAAVLMMRQAAIPAEHLLAVPFSPQAPFSNWANNENCEETSLIMAKAFFEKRSEQDLPPAEVQSQITMLNAWEDRTLGHHEDTGAEETARMAREVLGMSARQIKDFTEDNLKQALADNHVVLLPLSARALGNPQYADAGPLYHMILIRGYSKDGFIVNDPGTEKGAGNVYRFSVLKAAARDWNESAKKSDESRKIALILSK